MGNGELDGLNALGMPAGRSTGELRSPGTLSKALCLRLGVFAMPALAVLLCGRSYADTVVMTNGLKLEDCTVLKELPDYLVVTMERDGAVGSVKIPKWKIRAIEYDIAAAMAKLAPEDYRGHFELGRRALSKNLYKEAIELFDYALVSVREGKADGEGVIPDAYRLLGLAWEFAGDPAKALAAYEDYARSVPGDAAVRKKIEELAAVVKKEDVKPGPAAPAKPATTEGYEASGWSFRPWGYPATVVIQTEAATGNKILTVQGRPADPAKPADKTAFGRILAPPLDLTKTPRLTFKAYNGDKRNLHLAVFFINAAGEQYESRQLTIRPGWNDYEVRLDEKSFKSNKNQWQSYDLAFDGRQAVRELVLLIYHGANQQPLLSVDSIFFRQ